MATPNLGLETIQLTDNMQTSLVGKMNDNFSKIDNAYKVLEDNLLDKTGKSTISDAIESVSNLVNAEDGTITPDKVLSGFVGYAGQDKIVGTALSEVSTGSSDNLLQGKTFYDDAGTLITGNMADKSGTVTEAIGTLSETSFYLMNVPENGYYNTESILTRSKADVLNDMGVKPIPNISIALTGTNATTKGYVHNYGAGIGNDGILIIWATSNSTSYENISFVNTSIGAGTLHNGWNKTAFGTGNPTTVPYACTISGLGSYSNIAITLNVSGVNSTNDYIQMQVNLTAS